MNRQRKLTPAALTLTAFMAALSVLALYGAAYLPTGRIALAALAGVFPMAAVLRYGVRWGFGAYAVAALLSIFLLPVDGPMLCYWLFFGYYPTLKSLLERRGRIFEWALKLSLALVVIGALALFFRSFFVPLIEQYSLASALVVLIVLALFVVYDFALSGLVHVLSRQMERLGRH